MDSHPTPFPGKTQPLKPKTTRKTAVASKTTTKEPPISKQKRVFGTVQSTNIPVKTITDKPITKPSTGVVQKQPKSTSTTTTDNVAIYATIQVAKRDSNKKPKPRFDKKNIDSQEKVKVVNVLEPKTPVASPSVIKGKVEGPPYHSAKNCSKCRFDRLETASYWLGNIKLAESVGKRFVSLAFFHLAFDSNAEPIRNLQIELKRYLAQHGSLFTQTQWKNISRTYGILKDELTRGVNLDSRKDAPRKPRSCDFDQDQPQMEERQLDKP